MIIIIVDLTRPGPTVDTGVGTVEIRTSSILYHSCINKNYEESS